MKARSLKCSKSSDSVVSFQSRRDSILGGFLSSLDAHMHSLLHSRDLLYSLTAQWPGNVNIKRDLLAPLFKLSNFLCNFQMAQFVHKFLRMMQRLNVLKVPNKRFCSLIIRFFKIFSHRDFFTFISYPRSTPSKMT